MPSSVLFLAAWAAPGLLVLPKLFLPRASERQTSHQVLPLPPDTAEIPISRPLFPEDAAKAPGPRGGRRALTNYRGKMDCLDKV